MEENNNICDIRELTLAQLKELSDKYEWFGCAKRVIATNKEGEIKRSYLLCNIFEKHDSTALKKIDADEFIETAADDGVCGQQTKQQEDSDCKETEIAETDSAASEFISVPDAQHIENQSEASPMTGFDFSQTDSLIESFINSGAEHKISANNDTPDLEINDFTDNQNIDDEIVSEELAEIYRNQKLYSQAITIYRKLILLNPKKSVYFAEIIAEIEKNINN